MALHERGTAASRFNRNRENAGVVSERLRSARLAHSMRAPAAKTPWKKTNTLALPSLPGQDISMLPSVSAPINRSRKRITSGAGPIDFIQSCVTSMRQWRMALGFSGGRENCAGMKLHEPSTPGSRAGNEGWQAVDPHPAADWRNSYYRWLFLELLLPGWFGPRSLASRPLRISLLDRFGSQQMFPRARPANRVLPETCVQASPPQSLSPSIHSPPQGSRA
jgi:hypothetical protein